MAELLVEKLSFSRGDFRLQLDELRIRPGEKVAILGENGSGKSTLLQLLCGLLPCPGKVFYDDRPLSGITFPERARLFSLLPQFPEVIFPFSVEEVVLFGRFPYRHGDKFTEEDYRLRDFQLQQLDLVSLRHRPFNQLSGGEKRRVMLARVLTQQAPIIYLDEPNAGLDVRHTLEIFASLAGRLDTVIAPVHDVNLAERYFDRFLLFRQGELLADVPRQQLTPKLLSETYHVQVTAGTAAFTFHHR